MKLRFVKVGAVKDGVKNIRFAGEKTTKATSLGRAAVTKSYFFAVPEDEAISFIAGQEVDVPEAEFVTVDIPNTTVAMIYPR